jgi:hypothetical protein
MSAGELLLWGETQVGKTTLLATGLLAHPDRLPRIVWPVGSEGKEDEKARVKEVVMKHWMALGLNQPTEATAAVMELELPLANSNKMTVRDIRGGMTRNPFDEDVPRPWETHGILFVVEWEGKDVARHMNVVQTILPMCRGQKMGLAITKCDRGLDAHDPHWDAPPGWWREHACWRPYARVLEAFGAQVWPTSAYGFDADGRPACLLNEFGKVLPYRVAPRKVEVPFRWFFQELGLWGGEPGT